MNRSRFCVLLCVQVMLLSACGGGGPGGGGSIEPRGIEGSGRQITSAGGVTDTGSIFVNGVEYDLVGTEITVDGDPAGESDVDVGDVVIVEGDLDTNGTTGTARRVTAGIAVAGPIAEVDLALQQLTILGTTVVIGAGTRIVEGANTQPLGGLEVGDQIEVAGFPNSSGVLSARRISPRRASTPLRVKGDAEEVDSTRHRFRVNGQIVDYTNASLVGFSGRALQGAPVRVDADDVDAQGVLLATEVLFREPGLPGRAGDTAVVQGWVTRFEAPSDFDVDGHPVTTTASTVIEGPRQVLGSVLGEVQLDAFVLVVGRLTSTGAVEATKITTSEFVHTEAPIASIDAERLHTGNGGWIADSSCTWAPETLVQIDGLHATVQDLRVGDVATIYDHNSTCRFVSVEHNVRGTLESKPSNSAAFDVMGQRVWIGAATVGAQLAGLNVGDTVEVSGHATAEGDILARGIHRATSEGSYQVIGFAHAIDAVAKRFEVGRLTIDYSLATLAGFVAGVPAERDRVLVVSSSDTSGSGVLNAAVVRYAGELPRGAVGNLVGLGGLVTRISSREDFDVDGRRVVPAPKIHEELCSWGFVGPNMHLQLLVVGRPEASQFVFVDCPYYRDDLGFPRGPGANTSTNSGGGSIEVHGMVQAIDLDTRSMRVGGVNLMLLPTTQLTYSGEMGTGSDPFVVPMAFENLPVGSSFVHAYGPDQTIEGGVRPIDAILIDQDDYCCSEVASIRAGIESVSEPYIVLRTGIRIRVLSTTELCYRDRNFEFSKFFAAMQSWSDSILVEGTMNSDEFVASSVAWANAGCDQ